MRDSEFVAFAAELDAVFALYGKEPSADQKGMFFRVLRGFPLATVRLALDAHMADPQRGRFAPLPADVVAQVEAMVVQQDTRPGPEEAWAIAVSSADERNAVTWTEEIARAWRAASEVFEHGDEVGARMAFREVYNRLVAEARAEHRAAVWTVSAGTALEQRAGGAAVVALPSQRGQLPAPEAAAALPAPGESWGQLQAKAPPAAAQALLALKASLQERSDAPSRDVLQRQLTEELKARASEQAKRYGDVNMDECPGNVSDLMALAKARAARLAQGGGEKAA